VGLTRADVLDAAIDLAHDHGYGCLSVTALSRRLGIRSQSVYAHFESMEAIRRALQLRAYRELGVAIRTGVGDLVGRPAVLAWTGAHVRFDLANPALFAARNRPPGDDPELWEVIQESGATSRAVLASFGIEGEDSMHLTRLVWASLYGFVSLHHNGLLTQPVDAAESLRRMLDGLADQVEQYAAPPQRGRAAG
jgi:AcrR family transcriptional regulator